eukprot:9469941-Pyramimonas_sp.AAC.2
MCSKSRIAAALRSSTPPTTIVQKMGLVVTRFTGHAARALGTPGGNVSPSADTWDTSVPRIHHAHVLPTCLADVLGRDTSAGDARHAPRRAARRCRVVTRNGVHVGVPDHVGDACGDGGSQLPRPDLVRTWKATCSSDVLVVPIAS